jgi:hypothetical protein
MKRLCFGGLFRRKTATTELRILNAGSIKNELGEAEEEMVSTMGHYGTPALGRVAAEDGDDSGRRTHDLGDNDGPAFGAGRREETTPEIGSPLLEEQPLRMTTRIGFAFEEEDVTLLKRIRY